MTRYLSLCFILFITAYGMIHEAGVRDARAQGRIRDLSMSPEESLKQPSVNNNPVYQSDVTRRAVAKERDAGLLPPGELPPERPDAIPAKSFMEGYCDPNFISLLANNRRYFGREDCLKQMRDISCARFKNLPKEVKEVMDEAIGCQFDNANTYASDDPSQSENDYLVCATSYGRRIEMLKKYLADPYASYALVFLPDDVLDTPGRCVNRTDPVYPRKR